MESTNRRKSYQFIRFCGFLDYVIEFFSLVNPNYLTFFSHCLKEKSACPAKVFPVLENEAMDRDEEGKGVFIQRKMALLFQFTKLPLSLTFITGQWFVTRVHMTEMWMHLSVIMSLFPMRPKRNTWNSILIFKGQFSNNQLSGSTS